MPELEGWGYLGVFVAAAIPWLEILFVIPAGVAIGLSPLGVGVVAFVGNALPVAGIVLGHDVVVRRRRARQAGGGAGDPARASGRHARARRIMNRYGLPALAFAGPLVTGIHLAAAMALALGGRRGPVGLWMTASLAVWSAALVVLAEAGLALVRG